MAANALAAANMANAILGGTYTGDVSFHGCLMASQHGQWNLHDGHKYFALNSSLRINLLDARAAAVSSELFSCTLSFCSTAFSSGFRSDLGGLLAMVEIEATNWTCRVLMSSLVRKGEHGSGSPAGDPMEWIPPNLYKICLTTKTPFHDALQEAHASRLQTCDNTG